MAELPRARRDQIWLTRSHLGALGVMTLCIAALAFFIGVEVGERRVESAGAAPVTPLTPDASRERDMEALLREASKAGAAKDLSFPTELPQGGVTMPDGGAAAEAPTTSTVDPPVEGGPEAPTSAGDGVPAKGWAVQVGSYGTAEAADARVAELREADFAAYRVAVLVDGANTWRVRVGGYDDEAAAQGGAHALESALGLSALTVTRAP